ncbi:MAG TPA: hypothetical protein VKG67_05795 [Gallionellaceae bacterium]|nr:hypothetical protein [Gallionellaceae bacterium]
MDKTVKIPAISGDLPKGVAKDNLTKEQNLAIELATKNTQLEEEKKKSLEQQKSIEQLKEILKQEQAKSAELAKKTDEQEASVKELSDALSKISAIAAAGKAG